MKGSGFIVNWVDIVIAIIIALTTFSSLRTGLIKQAMTVIGLVVGVYAALGYYQRVGALLNPTIGNAVLSNAVAFGLILIAVWILAAVVASLVRRALNSLGLGWTDNALGMLVGFLVGLVIAVGFLLLLVRLPIPSLGQAVQQSSLASYIFLILPYLRQLLPSNVRMFEVI
jgi:membrane protein required for colicin V production